MQAPQSCRGPTTVSNLAYTMIFGLDGSLESYFQAEPPGADKHANWLPTPKAGHFGLVLRLYAPRREALHGDWTPPAVRRVI